MSRKMAERFAATDVFEVFEQAAGGETEVDPYPMFATLRREGGMHELDIHERLGVSAEISVTAAAGGYRDLDAQVFSAVSYDAVDAVLRDAGSFSQEVQRRTYGLVLGKVLTAMDAPEHRRMRSLVEQAFTRRSMEVWDERVIRPQVEAALRDVHARTDVVDLMSEVFLPYPARVICGLLGLPEDRIDRFMRLAIAMVTFQDLPLASWAGAEIDTWIEDIVQRRRTCPEGDDVIALLLRADVDGEHLTSEEIASFIRLLFPAGFETTYRALSNTVLGLLTSGQWALVRDDPSLVPRAVQEGLRWETSILGHPRMAIRDVDIGDTRVPEGAVVLAFHGAANRDETRWDDPDQFDITRPIKANATFGYGPHLCLGKRLAETELARAILRMTELFPNLRIDPGADSDDLKIRGLAFRSPRRLPVLLHG